MIPVGYSYLIRHYHLPVIPMDLEARISSGTRGRELRQQGGQLLLLFEPKYQPAESLAGQLQFALRYEGVNLQVLALLFNTALPERVGEVQSALCEWLLSSPNSQYARRACFLYEWLTQTVLPIADPVSERASYVDALDTRLQFAREPGVKWQRFRIINSLPGTPAYCPLVRKTPYLQGMIHKNLKGVTGATLAEYDEALLRRAAAWLYLKETQSSFELEREKPSASRAQRFADLLREADTGKPLNEDRLLELQHAVLDARFHEFTWRQRQNWLGDDLGYRQRVDFVPPRPDDVSALMQGLMDLAERESVRGMMEPVILAASVAFGFVFIHPFMDGNGRLHRYLIHDILAKTEFTPRGILLPVSAVILANLKQYTDALEHFSRPLNARTEYYPETPEMPAVGNDAVYFKYPDLTRQSEFLYNALERTVTEDMRREIDFLLGFDRAKRELNGLLDWPAQNVDLFIQLVYQNNGRLSSGKRKSHFSWMTDMEVSQSEVCVRQAFLLGGQEQQQS
ncbi:Fic family protein [Gammaproteobacteria bacterium LSUCC0112]|nr:Fic family protein [Gammaproteobacteria bacterium LSUCC0112]